MKKKSTSQSAFFNLRILIGAFFCLGAVAVVPTPTLAQCSWSPGPSLPSIGTRFVGVFFPANGKFYAMGGRFSDGGGGEFTHPFEYDPVGNSWTTKSATYPDGNVNNMACSVLNDSGTDYIYCVGGSQSVVNTVTGRVFRYDPVTDTLTTVAAPWPPGVNTLPGGFTVFSNKLYILGGFDNPPTGNSTNQIWEFTPSPAGWVQKTAVLPVPLGYIPTTTIGSLIYTGGGASITGGALTDTTNSFVYNPMAPIASGWQAAMMGLAPSWPRWKSSTARLVRARHPHQRRRLLPRLHQHQRLHRLQRLLLHLRPCRSRCTRMVTKCTACKRWTSFGVGRPRVTSTSIATAC